MAQNSQGMSNDTKTIITVLLLIFFYPIGIILVWTLTNWPKWVKWVLSIPVIILLVILLGSGPLLGINLKELFIGK